ncbi:MAG: TetR/AcrR family transcriptional regulator [Mycobacterium sp.]|uniref:TetR/AcrR family transcriptional regulator n=1 Tax=Mycobacterium sp. TaxID=1785 RepID=UPI003899FFA3
MTRRRGRPRAYDPAVAMRQARDTFWRGGYAATSLEDLSAGMGMNRPSIYAAFGDKHALYLRAATDYADISRSWLAAALARPRSLRDGLFAVYRYARDFYLAGDDAPRGCFLLGTAVTEAFRDAEVRAVVEETMTSFTTTFAERFERAERDGELSPHTPDALAQIATAALNSLAVRARTGADVAVLDALIDATVDVICG